MNQLQVPKIQMKAKLADKEARRACCLYAPSVLVCYDQQLKVPVPLKNVTYNIRVLKGLTCVEVEQVYSTLDRDQPIDLEYLFVINKNAAVTKMTVELGNKKVVGIIKEQQEAKQQYDEGIKQGKTMAYCDQDEEFPEIKKIKLGQLEPQKQLKIIFEYIQPLEVCFNKFYKIDISPIIDENYTQETKNNRRLHNFMNNIVNLNKIKNNFTQDFKVYIDTGSKITFYNSPTHSIKINVPKGVYFKDYIEEFQKLEIGLDENPDNYSPNKQFTFLFSTKDINLPTAILSHTSNDALQYQKYCATLTFVPKFNELPLDDAYQQYLENLSIGQNTRVRKGNYIFIIDRSCSMHGDRIKSAKMALTLFLKSLPEDCVFNIVSFGSECSSLWKESKTYNQEPLDEAVAHVETMEADFGGTEIRDTLNSVVYNENYGKQKDQTLNVFLLTDGGDTPGPIIELVQKNNKPDTRVYTIGIGEGCNQYLIKRIAEVGNGKCQFVSNTQDISEKVIDLLEDSITSQLEYFSINCNVSNISQIIPNPESIVSLKKNQLFTLQVLFSSDQIRKDFEFNLGWYDPQVQKQILYQVNLNLRDSQANEYFHKLAIHKYITYYEDAQRNGGDNLIQIKVNKKIIEDQDLINLSIEHQILSQRTAFICEICDVEDQFKQQKRQKILINKQDSDQDSYKSQRKDKSSSKQNVKLCKKQMVNYLFSCKPPVFCDDQPQMCIMPQCIINDANSQKDNKLASQQSGPDSGKRGSLIEEAEIHPNESSSDLDLQSKLMCYQRECILLKQNSSEKVEKEKTIKKQPSSYIEIVKYAQADGSFAFSLEMISQLHFNVMEGKENTAEKVWYTILALFYLELFCKEQKASWHLVYSKGITYLQKNGIKYLDQKGFLMEKFKQLMEAQ